jgi:carboxypeptidase Q
VGVQAQVPNRDAQLRINDNGGMRILLLVAVSVVTFGQERVDLTTVHQIKEEAFQRSKVMDILAGLTDLNGPRLTGSPEFKEAADWAMVRLKEYGVDNVRPEKWGPFGRSWSLKEYAVEMVAPRYSNMTAIPLAWSASTNGPITADAVYAPFVTPRFAMGKQFDAVLEKYRQEWTGKLRGKIVLTSSATKPVPGRTRPEFRRYTDAELADLAVAPEPRALPDAKELNVPEDPDAALQYIINLPWSMLEKLIDQFDDQTARRNQFYLDEGAVAVLRADDRARTGLVFAEQAGAVNAKHPMAAPAFNVTQEQYDRMVRLLEAKTAVKVRVNLKAEASAGDVDAFNIVGEIPGGSKRDEIVMVGAHFDSWHSGTGATDNGAGSAVMIEVMRILKALNLKMNRTVRIGLWSGEEEGLLGSKAYVTEHFGDSETMKLTAAHAKLAGYFNLDNGSGKIRGVYLQGNDAMRPVFEQWLAPFADLGAKTISIRDTGGTDHLSFDAVGLPGFQFIQDPLDYSTVTHHSDMDVYDRAVPADLMQAAAVIASMVYNTANRAEMLPRKALAKRP